MSSHLGKAIKNKITDKVGGAIGSVLAAPHNRKKRQYDREYAAIKDYQAMRDSGSSVVDTPKFRKAQAVYEDIKSRRS